ncbi:MAG: fibronectin type III domain-containing protein [Gemmatimonadota bacterium]|jgi:hypothetical protein|nr:hypothetical protein [Gemmatimonadota bacterium]MDP6528391.1 fibronectin type III domain-containing protein [Gemmatimonadota bacterium]MDP6802558.1 fibronectin type III domain-containing protein [Gemmatimonadota bacterium]MDP7031821.1 fibronectin type III domain-containing protein [Gemmatimonadota bacterium]
MDRIPRLALLLLLLFAAAAVSAVAQESNPGELPGADAVEPEAMVPPPAPPTGVHAEDFPHDAGEVIRVTWTTSPDDGNADVLGGYRVLRSVEGEAFESAGEVGPGESLYTDVGVDNGVACTYRVVAFGPGGEGESMTSEPAAASEQWFYLDRWNVAVVAFLVCGAILYYIYRAASGAKLYIRKIAGMDAVTEAVGRATEMGQPVLYVAGIQDMDNVQTVAGITILGTISRMIAEYETSLLMPTSRSIVMSTARETVKEAYLSAGRPDAYREENIYYVTDEQFGYVAHVDGVMLRKKPAACFYLGAFFAESLILAETGNHIGAIQVAGTAMPTQLPFFVAACDYTLIGEELFAASAYLSGDEKMLGSLKGSDMGKVLSGVFILAGSLSVTLANVTGSGFLANVSSWLDRLWSAAH